MSQYRNGVITGSASAINLNLGFVPDYFELVDYTIQTNGTYTGIALAQWYGPLSPSPSAIITTYTTGSPAISYITTNGISAINLGGDWQNTQYTINNISSATPAVVTVASISPTNTLTLVNGMTVTISDLVVAANGDAITNLNGNRFIISNLTIVGGGPTYTFTLYDLFGNPVKAQGTYVTGATGTLGLLNQISYPPTAPILNPVNGQVITPGQPAGNQYDIGYMGVSIGTGCYAASTDTLFYQAWSSTPTGW